MDAAEGFKGGGRVVLHACPVSAPPVTHVFQRQEWRAAPSAALSVVMKPVASLGTHVGAPLRSSANLSRVSAVFTSGAAALSCVMMMIIIITSFI